MPVTLVGEFEKLAIKGHVGHTGLSVERTKFDELADCQFSFCRVRHKLVDDHTDREIEIAHILDPLDQPEVVTSLPEVISNTKSLYEGNLEPYLRVLFTQAQNLWFPYHNFRHMLHVTWMTYRGCEFYQDELTPRDIRNVLIAALFHDFDHSGMLGNDDLNIERSCRALQKHILPEDLSWGVEIEALIKATEFPPPQKVIDSPCADIIRDADLSQAFSTAWVQQVIFGLAAEWCQSPLEVLRKQHGFLSSLRLRTAWARTLFPQSVIDAKIAEAAALLAILEV